MIHLSDLHLGKRVNEFSMYDDQVYILNQITAMVEQERPDGVLIAGDVYDKSVPSAEAVSLLDDFLTVLSKKGVQVYLISGNHDSPERLSFGARLMERSGVHLAGVYDGPVKPIVLKDGQGELFLYLLPFIKPAHLRRFFPEEEIASYTDAMRLAIGAMEVDPSARNVLVTHQFVTGASRCDSEELSVGGSDNVDVEVFKDFDYVALGHIHSPQSCGSERVRYCGTPLKYSFSEAKDRKSVTVVELGKKGELTVRTLPLAPKHDLVELKGAYDELMSKSFYENTTYREDYVHITLTDEEDVPEAVGRLRTVYKGLMKLDYDNLRTGSGGGVLIGSAQADRTPFELFSELYLMQNGRAMSEEQSAYVKELIEEVWEEEK